MRIDACAKGIVRAPVDYFLRTNEQDSPALLSFQRDNEGDSWVLPPNA